MDDENRRIVLLGKTGAGKRSLANTILGEKDLFKEGSLANSETSKCEANEARINGRNIRLVDTPGFFDTDLENSTELTSEILRCITECAPGPHAFLIVLKVERYTKQEQAVVDEIIKCFSEDVLKYTTVIFTRGDDLPQEKRIKEWVRENESLRKLVDKCGGRCHVFDNKYWNNSQDQYRNNQVQVKELLETIEKTVTENGGKYYTNTFLRMVICNMKRFWSKIMQYSPRVLLRAFLGSETEAAALLVVASTEEEEGARSSEHIQEIDTMRIVLLGKTGSGKSSLANIIFGERHIFKIDPPGLFDTDSTITDESPEILRCMTECAPGPHAFLLVLKVERYTKQEEAVVDEIIKYFTEDVLKYTTVVFTHGDDLPEGMRIKDWVNETVALRKLVDKCGGRCHVFDNKYWNNSQDQYRNNQVQVKELLETIDNTVRKNKRFYTNDMLSEVEREIQKEIDSTLPHLLKNMSAREVREKAKDNVYKRLLKKGSNNNYNTILRAVATVVFGIVCVIIFNATIFSVTV